MAPSIATVKITKDAVLPLRIFVNRKQLLQNNSDDTVFHTPLLSNNSIVYIKSPSTRIYLSNHDMNDLCNEIKSDLLLIVYELTSQVIMEKVLGNLRVGQTTDFRAALGYLFKGKSAEIITSHIQTITRVAKSQYKLHFKKNWELEIFIKSIKRLVDIRGFLLFKEYGSGSTTMGLYSKRKVLIMEKEELQPPEVLQEDDDQGTESMSGVGAIQDHKPELTFEYKPVINLGECVDIHILQRPKRQRQTGRQAEISKA